MEALSSFFLVPHAIVDLLHSFFSQIGAVDGFGVVVGDSSQLGGSCDGVSFLVDESY